MAAAKLDDLLKQSKAAGTSKATYKFELLTEEQLFAVLNKSSHSGCTIQCYGLANDVDIDKIKDRTEFHL
jgi:hypothetical protein